MKTEDQISERRQVILMLTQTCNLNCKYCYQNHKKAGRMAVETAKAILAKELDAINNDELTRTMEISFLGGEPLLNFATLKEAAEWLWSQKSVKPLELTVRTNGTLLDDDMKAWFLLNKNRISLGLSLDGLSDMNKLNRSSNNVDWRFFVENWPSQRVNVVLFSDTVQYLARSVEEMKENGMSFNVTIGEGFEWTTEQASVLEEQLMSLISLYLDDSEEAVASGLFPSRVSDFFPETPIEQFPFCWKRNNTIAYNADGSPSICHMFTKPSQGEMLSKWSWETLREVESVPSDPVCVKCPVQKNCKRCFGLDLKVCGSIFKSASRVTTCRAVKARARASAMYFLKHLEYKKLHGEPITPFDFEDATKALRLLEELHYC